MGTSTYTARSGDQFNFSNSNWAKAALHRGRVFALALAAAVVIMVSSATGNAASVFGGPVCSTAGPIEIQSTTGTAALIPTAYPTLKAGFDAINLGVIHTGVITVEVCGNTTETASAVLNSGAVAPASYTSVNIYPVAAPRTITGSIVGAVIKLNGADNVTIDGRLGTANTRDLTISNSSAVTATAGVWLASVAAGNGASNNVVRNLEVACGVTQNTATLTTIGILMGGTTVSVTADGPDNDNNQIIFNRVVRSRYGIVTRGAAGNLNIAPTITDNIVGPAAFGTDEIGKVGIFMQFDTGAIVSRNTVQFVGGDFANTTGGADRVGIAIGVESWSLTPTTLVSDSYTVSKNVIHDIIEERTFSSLGILLATANGGNPTNDIVANNFIFNVKANSTSGDQTVGLGIAGGHTDRVVFNSISLTGDVDPTAAASTPTMHGSGIRIANLNSATHANLTLKNNSVLMDLSSSSAPTARFYAISGPGAGYSFGTGGENNNNLFINPTNPQAVTGGLGTNSAVALTTQFPTLANWQTAYTPNQDLASIQADPQYVSNTGDLHIAAASPNVNAGVAIPGVADDIDGQLRVGAPDIGADEPAGVTPPLHDVAPSAILNPVPGGNVPAGVPFAPQASFTGIGTATETNVPVRFRLVNSSSVEVCNVTALIPSISNGQSVTVTFPTCTAPTAGAYTMFARSELVGDANAANDEVSGTVNALTPLSGTLTVGTGGTYTSLTNPGGVFEAINTVGASSNLTINIISDLSGETGTVALNEIGGFTVTIKPSGAARTITGSSSNSIIRLNGADGVTIDGSLAGGTATGVGGTASLRNLTVQNTNTAATAGAVIAIMQGNNSANNDTVKNVNVLGQDPTQTLIGIHVGGNAIGASPVGSSNTNIVIDNCTFKRSFIAAFNNGASAAVPATGSVISHNDLSFTGADRLRRAGFFFFFQNGIQVTENKIGGIVADEAADAIGIIAGIQDVTTTSVTSGGITNSLIARNLISGIASTNTTGFSAVGIAIAGDAGQNLVVNNMISGVVSPATSPDLVAGIFVAGVTAPASNTAVYFNSISMTGDRGAVAAQIGSYGIAISGTNPVVDLKNNIFSTTQTSAGGANAKSYAIGMTSTTFTNLSSDFNDFWSTGANDGGFRTGSLSTTGTDLANLAAWQAATGKDASSKELDPLFVNAASNLHILQLSPARNAGTPIGSVTNDIDLEARPNAADPAGVQVDIGSDEFYLLTAAGVTISGRVTSIDGRGIRNAAVTISGGTLLSPITVMTGPGGVYHFDDIAAGQTYLVTVNARRFVFQSPNRVIQVEDNVTDADFVGTQGNSGRDN